MVILLEEQDRYVLGRGCSMLGLACHSVLLQRLRKWEVKAIGELLATGDVSS